MVIVDEGSREEDIMCFRQCSDACADAVDALQKVCDLVFPQVNDSDPEGVKEYITKWRKMCMDLMEELINQGIGYDMRASDAVDYERVVEYITNCDTDETYTVVRYAPKNGDN